MIRNATNLRVKQQRAIKTLLTEPTIQKAARAANVSKATLFRWLSEPAFADTLRETSARLLDGAVATLQAGSSEAVQCLRQVIADADAPVAAKVSAARTILEMALRTKELFEHERRIEELEQRIASLNGVPALRRVK